MTRNIVPRSPSMINFAFDIFFFHEPFQNASKINTEIERIEKKIYEVQKSTLQGA